MIAKPSMSVPRRATTTLVSASAMLFITRWGVQRHSSPCSMARRDKRGDRHGVGRHGQADVAFGDHEWHSGPCRPAATMQANPDSDPPPCPCVHRSFCPCSCWPARSRTRRATRWPTLRALVEQSQAQVKVDPERSRQLAEQALQLLATQPDADLQVRAHLLLCDYHSERDRAAAEQQHGPGPRAGAPAQAQGAGRRACCGCEGELHESAGDNTRALALYEQEVQLAEQAQDDEMLADGLYKRGHLRGVRGEFANGLIDLKRARALFERLQLPLYTLTVENTIAILYNRMGDHAQARHYYELTLKAQAAAGLLREQAVTQYNLGRSLENLGDWDAAERAFDNVLKLSRELDYTRGIAYALRGLASVQNARKQPQQALSLLGQAADDADEACPTRA